MDTTAKETALKILNESIIGTMSTVSQNKPHSRYMTFFNDDFTIYSATNKRTHKVEEIQENPHTHILLGFDGKGIGDAFLEIEGTIEESQDEDMKEAVWNRHLEGWFEGPEDPNLMILKVTPTQIRVMNKTGKEPEIVQL